MTGDIDLSLVTEQGSYDLTAKGGSANIGGMYVGLCLIEFILHNKCGLLYKTVHVILIKDRTCILLVYRLAC